MTPMYTTQNPSAQNLHTIQTRSRPIHGSLAIKKESQTKQG